MKTINIIRLFDDYEDEVTISTTRTIKEVEKSLKDFFKTHGINDWDFEELLEVCGDENFKEINFDEIYLPNMFNESDEE